MLLGTAHHFAIGSEAFREGRVFSNFEGISGWGCETSECMVLSSCCGQQANVFSKILTYKRAYSGVKIIIVRARPGRQLWYFLFSHRAQGKLGSRLYALSKALIAFRFCTRIGQTEAQVLQCAPARNNVLIQSYRGAEDRGAETLWASVSRTTFSIMPILASVCSTGGCLQMVKISKHSVGKLKSYEH